MTQTQWFMRVENGLSAHFSQENGPSKPGVMWVVQLKQASSDTVYKAMVKALITDDLAANLKKDKEYQAQIAMQYLNEKISAGWHPQDEMDHTIYISNPGSAKSAKKWWQFWQ